VLFAWMSWREARLSRLEQRQALDAINAPDVTLDSIRLIPNPPASSGLLTLYLRNAGGSPAESIGVGLIVIGSDSALRDTRNIGDVFRGVGLEKGQRLALPLERVESIEAAIGWRPHRVRLYEFGQPLARGERITLLLEIRFKSPFGAEHARLVSLATAP
jgi:hypothetical protein